MFLWANALLAQSFRGRLMDAQSSQALAYGSVQSFPSGRATLADEQGFFALQIAPGDLRLEVRLLGYVPLQLSLLSADSLHILFMQPQVWQLAEVTVRPENDAWLYPLLANCKAGNRQPLTTRAYYELRSELGGRQLELVEGFYNAQLQGAELRKLQLKAGRLALQPIDRRLFANTETALALGEMPLFGQPKYLPGSPLGLSESRLRRQYQLFEQGSYRLENGDSVVVIRFVPKRQKEAWFEGELGLILSQKALHFIRLRCSGAAIHPFLPLSPGERLSQVKLELSRSMVPSAGGMRLEKLEMHYGVTYANQRGQVYPVNSSALLYCYAPEEPFFIPPIDFGKEDDWSDYLRINAQPYQAAFWENSRETRVEDVQGRNAAFFKDPRSITNVNLFTNQPLLGKGLIERPFTHWDGRRLIFNGITERPLPADPRKREVRVDDFQLEVLLYFDLYPLGDTLHWQTATIFDPYRSYFYLPIGPKEQCFINLYFDLMEIERRKLQEALVASDRRKESLLAIHQQAQINARQMAEAYFRDAMLGNSRKGMESWNEKVKQALGINNLQQFGLLE
ncbi:MAG: hypothetical protein C0424_07865 [Sphingobacteriaceae bacterium]|nr:hypothetical protein [Sphingobacteriaceae bacterium]